MKTTATVPVPQEHIVATEFDGGEGVLVDLNTKQYYQLNETAMLIWQQLEKNRSLEEIVNHITEVYDVAPEHARKSVENALRDFQERKLVHKP